MSVRQIRTRKPTFGHLERSENPKFGFVMEPAMLIKIKEFARKADVSCAEAVRQLIERGLERRK